MNNNLPAIKKDGIFAKIKNWFSKLFKKYENKEEYFPEEKSQQCENKTDFRENIKVENILIANQNKETEFITI